MNSAEAALPARAPLRASAAPKPLLRWAVFLLALLGWWISLDLLNISLGGRAGIPGLQALCEGGRDRRLDCKSVLGSAQARLFGEAGGRSIWTSIPWAALGGAYFAFVALWQLFVGPATRDAVRWHWLITILAVVAALASLRLIWIMAFELNRWCAGCLLVHAINAVMLVLILLAFPRRGAPSSTAPHPPGRLGLAALWAGGAVAALHVVVPLMLWMEISFNQMRDTLKGIVEDPTFGFWNYARQPVQTIPPRAGEVSEGPADAPFTAVIFSDFECPYCKAAHETLAQLRAKYPERLRIVYRHYPMNSECNPAFPSPVHPAACRAALAAEAARLAGGPAAFLRLKALLYERRDDLQNAPFQDWAVECGLARETFDKKQNSLEPAAALRADVETGIQLKLNGIPAIFVNGKRLEDWGGFRTWEAILRNPSATQPATDQSPVAAPPTGENP